MSRFLGAIKKHWRMPLVYAAVAVFILWPLLGPGYILTLDMVFAPKLTLPEVVTSSYLLHAGLHLLNAIIPSDVIQKLMLLAILILSGIGMHRLMHMLQTLGTPFVAATSQWGVYASGLLYMVNPFVYSRFMAGQYSVLLGYAFLPFFVVSLLRFLRSPSLKTALILAAWIIGIGVVSIHTLGIAFVVGLVALIQTVWQHRSHPGQLGRIAKYVAVAAIVFFVASSYWLLPLLQGSGPTATSIATFQTSDQSAFETEGNSIVSKLIHVLRLQGFWGEREGLYLLPQDQFILWPVVVIVLWIVVVVGARSLWRRNQALFIIFVSSTAIATMLAVGIGAAWLSEHVPFFAGYREPQKFVALVVLGYAVFFGFAISNMTERVRSKAGRVLSVIAGGVLIIGLTPVMFGGFDGQLVPRQYPADWYTVNEQLNKDNDTFEVLFLPWHLYMRYQFAGRVIAHPANGFFDKPIITSDDPELQGTKAALDDSRKQQLSRRILPEAAASSTLGAQLGPLRVKYIILAKDADYKTYDYLDHQKDLQLVSETAILKLYRNTAFRKDGE